MYPRHLSVLVEEALADTPVVLLVGARQVGKTTLVQSLIGERYPARSITLDDSTVLAAVRADPTGSLAGYLSGRPAGTVAPLAIDEVQRAPELFPAIKAAVDRHRVPGRFLLTSSTNVLTLSKLSESLAGRMEVLTLWPLAQSEIAGVDRNAVDALFAPQFPVTEMPGVARADLIGRLLAGGVSGAVGAAERGPATGVVQLLPDHDFAAGCARPVQHRGPHRNPPSAGAAGGAYGFAA